MAYVQLRECPRMLGFHVPNAHVLIPRQAELNIERWTNVICTFLLQSDTRRTFFVPHNGGGHCMLAVISPTQDKVVWLDPLAVKVLVNFRRMIAL